MHHANTPCNTDPLTPSHLYILNDKNLAPLSISFFSGSKLIPSNFSVIQMMCPCRKIIIFCHKIECLGMPGNSKALFGEKCQNNDFFLA